MVNYVLSFCKITAASRLFSRNFYLPLLKPQTPKDALRTFKITGKWLLGAKIQHYIPVLLNHRKKRSNRLKNYGKKVHQLMDGYVYMVPILDLDATNETHRFLLNLLNGDSGTIQNGGTIYVYTVEDRKYNILIEPRLEAAILNGDIIDILVSQRNDKIIIKLKNMKKIPVELQYFDSFDQKHLYHGEGTTRPEDEKFHHHGKYTMGLARIFEEKELAEEKWEEELKRILRKRRRQPGEGSRDWRAMISDTIRMLGQRFEAEAKKVIEEIDEPANEQTLQMDIDDLSRTQNVNETILESGTDLLSQLPTMKEIPDIIRHMGSATTYEIPLDKSDQSLLGVKVVLPSGRECFVSGQMVHTEDGDVFVPGQTVENKYGMEYSPGITINIDNKPTLISGLIMGEQEQDAVFLPTQSTITADGQLTFATTAEERPPQIVREQSPVPDQIQEDEEEELTLSTELNTEELEELDMEAIRLKHDQELEKLKSILNDDGMDEIIANLEEKKRKLQQKLEELRRLSLIRETTLISYISDADTVRIASAIASDRDTINRLSDVLMTLIRRTATFRDRNSIHAENLQQAHISVAHPNEADLKFSKVSNKLKLLLKSALVSANDVFKARPKDQILALQAISEVLIDVLHNDPHTLANLLQLLNTPNDRIEIMDAIFRQMTQNIADTKVAKIHQLGQFNGTNPENCHTCIEKVLGKGNELASGAFIKLTKLNPKLLTILADNLRPHLNRIRNEDEVQELLQTAIVDSIQTQIKTNLEEILTDGEFTAQLLETADNFATALGQCTQYGKLSERHQNDWPEATKQFLVRITIILQLVEKDYSLKKSIERLRRNPERARNDPRIRQLIRESAVLLPRKSSILQSSRDIDTALIRNQNLLALEDFLLQRNRNCAVDLPVLISRGNSQAVVPKEAARGVLAGRVAYVLIDENGISSFKPTHMFTGVSGSFGRDKKIDEYLKERRGSVEDRIGSKYRKKTVSPKPYL